MFDRTNQNLNLERFFYLAHTGEVFHSRHKLVQISNLWTLLNLKRHLVSVRKLQN